jgi:hypothetical protein
MREDRTSISDPLFLTDKNINFYTYLALKELLIKGLCLSGAPRIIVIRLIADFFEKKVFTTRKKAGSGE